MFTTIVEVLSAHQEPHMCRIYIRVRLVKVGRNSEIQSEVSVPEQCWQATFVDVFTKRALTLAGLHKLDIRYLAAHSPTFRPRIRAEGTRDTFHLRPILTKIHFGKTPLMCYWKVCLLLVTSRMRRTRIMSPLTPELVRQASGR